MNIDSKENENNYTFDDDYNINQYTFDEDHNNTMHQPQRTNNNNNNNKNNKTKQQNVEPRISQYTVNPIKTIPTTNMEEYKKINGKYKDTIKYKPSDQMLEIHIFQPKKCKSNTNKVAAYTKFEIPTIYKNGVFYPKETWSITKNGNQTIDLTKGLLDNEEIRKEQLATPTPEPTPLTKFRASQKSITNEEITKKLLLERKGKTWTTEKWEIINNKYFDTNINRLQLERHGKKLKELRNIINTQQPPIQTQGKLQGPTMSLYHRCFKDFIESADPNAVYKCMRILWTHSNGHEIKRIKLQDVTIKALKPDKNKNNNNNNNYINNQIQNSNNNNNNNNKHESQYGIKLIINMNSDKITKINWVRFAADIPRYIIINNQPVNAIYNGPRVHYPVYSTGLINIPSNIRNTSMENQKKYIMDGYKQIYSNLLVLNYCTDLINKQYDATIANVSSVSYAYYGNLKGYHRLILQQRLNCKNLIKKYTKFDGRQYCLKVLNELCENCDYQLSTPPFLNHLVFPQWINVMAPDNAIKSIGKSFKQTLNIDTTSHKIKPLMIHWNGNNPVTVIGDELNKIPRPRFLIINVRKQNYIIKINPNQLYLDSMKYCNACSMVGHLAQECIQLASYIKAQEIRITQQAKSKRWNSQKILNEKKKIIRKRCNKCSLWGHTKNNCTCSSCTCCKCGGGHNTNNNMNSCKSAETIIYILDKYIRMKENGNYRKGMSPKDVLLYDESKEEEKQPSIIPSTIPSSIRSEVPSLITTISQSPINANQQKNSAAISINAAKSANTITLNVLHENETNQLPTNTANTTTTTTTHTTTTTITTNNNNNNNRNNDCDNDQIMRVPSPSSISPSPSTLPADFNVSEEINKSEQREERRQKLQQQNAPRLEMQSNNDNKQNKNKKRGRAKKRKTLKTHKKGPKRQPPKSESPGVRSRSRSKGRISLQRQITSSSSDDDIRKNYKYNKNNKNKRDEDDDTTMPNQQN